MVKKKFIYTPWSSGHDLPFYIPPTTPNVRVYCVTKEYSCCPHHLHTQLGLLLFSIFHLWICLFLSPQPTFPTSHEPVAWNSCPLTVLRMIQLHFCLHSTLQLRKSNNICLTYIHSWFCCAYVHWCIPIWCGYMWYSAQWEVRVQEGGGVSAFLVDAPPTLGPCCLHITWPSNFYHKT